jgi:hypothetical protein
MWSSKAVPAGFLGLPSDLIRPPSPRQSRSAPRAVSVALLRSWHSPSEHVEVASLMDPRVAPPQLKQVFEDTTRPKRRPLADLLDLPPGVRSRLGDPDDAVEIVRALVEAAGLPVQVQDDVVLALPGRAPPGVPRPSAASRGAGGPTTTWGFVKRDEKSVSAPEKFTSFERESPQPGRGLERKSGAKTHCTGGKLHPDQRRELFDGWRGGIARENGGAPVRTCRLIPGRRGTGYRVACGTGG